jgi:hypothetical protein
LALRLSFNSKKIRQLEADDLFKSKACNFLLKYNPPELYDFDQQLLEDCVENIAKAYTSIVEKEKEYIKLLLVVEGEGKSLLQQYRRFFQSAYKYVRNYLFLEVLYKSSYVRAKGIILFFVIRSIYFAFFGNPTSSTRTDIPGIKLQTQPGGDIDFASSIYNYSYINTNPRSIPYQASTNGFLLQTGVDIQESEDRESSNIAPRPGLVPREQRPLRLPASKNIYIRPIIHFQY